MNTAIRAVRRQLYENAVRPARRGLRRGGAAFSYWARSENNPFLARAVRTEARRGRLFWMLALAALLVAALLGVAWLYFSDTGNLYDEPGQFFKTYGPNSPSAQFFTTYWLSSPSWGSNIIGFCAIATALVSALVTVYVTRVRAASLLRQEVLRGTIEQLQLLPVAEERWLWQMSAHLVLTALCIFSAGLPLYALAVFSGVWRAQDVLGMALLFAMLGYVAPTWNPITWRAAAKKAPDPKNRVKWKDAVAISGINDPDLSPSQKMEAQRRFQRLISGFQTSDAAAQTAVVKAQTEGIKPAASTRAFNAQAIGLTMSGNRGDANPQAQSNGCLLRGLVWLGVMFSGGIAQVMGAASIARLWSALYGGVTRGFSLAWPPEVKELLGAGMVFSWPLLLARALVAPVPFFSIRLPFALLLLPLMIAIWRAANVTLAARVSTSETFWTPRRARVQSSSGSAMLVLALLIIVGMTWREIIGNGSLGDMLIGSNAAVPSRALSVAAAWTLALVAATLYAGKKLEAPFARAGRGKLAPRDAWRQGGAIIARVAAMTALAYFALSWFGGIAGVSGVWWQRLIPTLATAAAFLLADFGGAALQSQLRGFAQTAFRGARFLWFWGFLIEIAIHSALIASHNVAAAVTAGAGMPSMPGAPPMAAGAATKAALATAPGFSFDQAPHVLLSPVVTLLALFRSDLSPAVSAQKAAWLPASLTHIYWWIGPLAQAAIGLALIGIAAPAAFSGVARAQSEGDALSSLWARLLRVLAVPFVWLGKMWRVFWTALTRVFAGLNVRLRRINEAVIARAFSYDNAVLTSEVRRKARRTNWALHWLLAFCIGALLFLSIPIPLWFYNWLGTPIPTPNVGAGVVYFSLGAASLLAWLGVSDGGLSFDRDRADGTLVFLFLTPLSDAEILRGKTWVQYGYMLPILLTTIPWILLGAVGALFESDSSSLLIAIFGFPAVLSVLYFAIHAQILFAVRAKKPTEGAAKALVACIVLELALWILLGAWITILGAPGVIFSLLVAIVIHLFLGFLAWHWALSSMHAIRYGDVKASGKGAA